MPTFRFSFYPRSFVFGVSFYSNDRNCWQADFYFGPLFMQVNALKPHTLRWKQRRKWLQNQP